MSVSPRNRLALSVGIATLSLALAPSSVSAEPMERKRALSRSFGAESTRSWAAPQDTDCIEGQENRRPSNDGGTQSDPEEKRRGKISKTWLQGIQGSDRS